MRRLRISHNTTYCYSNTVTFQPHQLLMRPRDGHDLRIESSKLEIVPAHAMRWHRDVYNNSVAIVTFEAPADHLKVTSEVVIQHFDAAPLDFVVIDEAVSYPFHYDPSERLDLTPYITPVFPDDSGVIKSWLEQFWQPGQLVETYVLLDQINRAIPKQSAYTMREEPGIQAPSTTLAQQRGSCRDFATLFIETCRYLGLAARFVSGYLHCEATEVGHGSTHAWAEVYLPGAGWKGFDSTSGEVVGSHHIAVAVHRHPEAVPPLSGSFVGDLEQPPQMTVDVKVEEIDEGLNESST